MLLPVSILRRSPRGRRAAWGALAAGLVLCMAVAASADASTLRHVYRFDPARLQLGGEPAAPALLAGDLPRTWELGQPELPYEILTFVVPRGSRAVAIRARTLGDHLYLDGVQLAAAAELVDTDGGRAQPPAPQAVGAHALASAGTAAYPPVFAEIAGDGALHGYQLLSVRVYPVRYEAALGRVWAADGIDLEVDLAPGGRLPIERERFSAAIETAALATLNRLAANPTALLNYDRRIGLLVEPTRGGFHPTEAPSLEGSEVEYLIITSDALAATWQTLADWKTRRGVPTVVRTVEWIQANYRRGSDLQETIRTFVQDAYAKWAVRYVLLGGDTDILPARYGYSSFGDPTEREIPCDAYFACLDGNWNLNGNGFWGEAAVSVSDPGDSTDFYAEVFIGRAPASTTSDVTAYINKVTSYENPAQTAYQNQVLLLAEVLFPVSWDTSQTISMDGGAFSEELLTYLTGCTSTTRLYENYYDYPGALPLTKSAALAQMSTGYGYVNHIGHGGRYNMSLGDASMQNYDALALTNSTKRFVLYMLNCTATAFDFPCLAEAFLKSNGGAVAVLGASRAAYALPSRNYNVGFVNAVYQNGYTHLGEAFVQSRIAQTPNAWFDTADHYSHLLYNFLGDPELVMHTCTLGTTVATHTGSLGLGLTNVTVNVTVGGSPREGALVCLQKGTEEYQYETTDVNGDAVLAFRAESAGTVQVTVTGANMTTYLGSISVGNTGGPYVSVQSLSFSDDSSGLSNGNADGVLDAGETLELSGTFYNSGSSTASGVTGVLRIASAYATLVDSTYTLGTITSGGTGTATNQLLFTVASNTPDGTVLPLTFVTTNGSATWTDRVNKVIHAPRMELTLLDVDDYAPGGNGDGIIQAGETFDLLVYWKNFGTGAADGLGATLNSSDPDITITNGSVSLGRANAMQELTSASRFRLQEATLDANPLVLQLTDNRSRTLTSNITLRGPAAPGAPTLDASTGANVIVVTWPVSADSDLAGYHVYRAFSGSGPWSRVTIDRTVRVAYFRDTGLLPSTLYFYRTTAVDSSGNESSPSPSSNINTQVAQLSGWPIALGSSSSCTPAVGDITGDGSKEILAGNDHLYAWNWNGIELRDDDDDPQTWGIFATEIKTVTGAVALGELDRLNPGFEIFVTTWDDTNKAFCVRGDGSFLTGWPQNPNPTSPQKGYWGDSSVFDVDGDGLCEVFGPAKNGNLYAWRANGTPLGASAAFKTGLGTYMRCSPSFANLDGDPQYEIIFGSPTGVLHIWNVDGSNYGPFPKTAGTLSYGNTAVGDVNDDGILDVVYVTEGGAINIYDTRTGNQLTGWPKSIVMKSSAKTPSPALADFEGDGKLEIVIANNGFPASNSQMQIYNYLGALLSGWPILTGGNASESSPIVADFSGDGVPDILFGNEGGLIYGWTKNGVALPGFPLTVGDFIRAVPVADDIDGDGNINLVLTGWDKNVYVWNFLVPFNKNAAQWPTLKHDMQRSGQYGWHIDSPTDVGSGDGDDPSSSPPPAAAFLSQNVPNPFNPTTRIQYGVPVTAAGRSTVRLEVYDARGRRVRVLLQGEQPPGNYGAIWDGRDDAGRRVETGVYFSRLQIDSQILAKKMVMLK